MENDQAIMNRIHNIQNKIGEKKRKSSTHSRMELIKEVNLSENGKNSR